MGDMMTFPASVEEFMEQYKMTDTGHVYSNGTEYVPIYRMKQWFEHCRNQQLHTIDAVPVVRCRDCKRRYTDSWCEYVDDDDNFYCARGKQKDGDSNG